MKHLTAIFTFTFLLHLSASAAVPLRWTVETSRAQPATFDEFAGATYDLEATLQSYGRQLAVDGEPRLYWQTNGMASSWWSAPATVSGNVLRATWTPACDVGAKAYNCFIGITGTVYNAAFQLRLRPSPGTVPNELPLPQKVIDFAQVNVVNPPWPTGSARPLPPYLHAIDIDDTYPDDAAWAYERSGSLGRCSAKRDGGALYRNYDWSFDSTAEFVVRVNGDANRFASIGVANCGTNLSEDVVTSGKWSRWYKCLPGMTLDGINANGVVAEINVCTTNGMERWNANGSVHVLGAVRWALDHGTNAIQAASYLAANVKRPQTMNFHYMIADEHETWIVENGKATRMDGVAIMTNHGLFPYVEGPGVERDAVLQGGAITNVWWTKAYGYGTDWISDFESAEQMAVAQGLWNAPGKAREDFRGAGDWWQTVHTSVYDISNRTLRVAVQETDDWYMFGFGGCRAKLNKLGEMVDLKRDKTDLSVYGWIEAENTNWVWYALSWNVPAGFVERMNAEAVIPRYDTRWHLSYSDGEYVCDDWVYGSDYDGDDESLAKYVVANFYLHGELDEENFYVVAKRSSAFVKSLTATNSLATKNDLDAKRDLTDRTFVTYEPGDWSPSVIDGIWYSPQWYGDGWSVEKYRWYDEWGEWYWEDSEWIYGPGEDAMTLVAHKLWSDEEITLTRARVPVEDSLALESQIGSVAQSAAREYLNDNDLVKWKKILRTGLPGQWGTGWGNVHWEFASDRRWWTMKVPDFTATVTAGGHVDSNGNDVVSSSITIDGRSYVTDPMRRITRTPVKILTQTEGTNGTERCATATWNSVLVPTGEQSAIDDPDACAYAIRFSIDFQDGLSDVSVLPRRLLAPVVYNDGAYYETLYTMSDFSAEVESATNSSATVKCRYACRARYRPSVSSYTPVTYTNWFTVAISNPSGAYTEITKEYGRVITSNTRNLFWDPSLHATWRIDVTNGCFFSEIVSTNNLTGVR